MIRLQRIAYADLNAKQKEVYNFHKVAAHLADYGFNCMKLSDDWQGADFLAYHKDHNDTLKVQLKARLTIAKKYIGKDLYIAFPDRNSWYLVSHEILLRLVGEHSNWLNSESWKTEGKYHSDAPNGILMASLSECVLNGL